MIFNIMNSLKAKDTEKVWFDTNSVAGLVFYGSAVIVIALFMTGHKLPGGIVLCIMFILPLLVMFLKEPLTNLVEKKPAAFEGGVGMFIVQGFFEMFEVLFELFLQHTFFRAYRSLCSQPCSYDAGCTDAGRCRERKPELGSDCSRKYFRMRS